ncbi:hypothetical protein SAY87_006928 [Trapa incisa]|uniref:Phototropic-responsive NPH3 family protein n=1 Tax=Trapa incisa TaxID=236973 RepID=A0AAN7JZX2_9MYRT|nr:hypothetical protein SAY87_006928 [Trapa incisa]
MNNAHYKPKRRLCSTGLPSDVIIEVGDSSFHLHKFPLLSRSGLLQSLIHRSSSSLHDDQSCVVHLHDVPGGPETFCLAAKFCYGVKIELNALNVVALRCAAQYLQMTEEYGEDNLVFQAERLLDEVFGSWTDSIRALETCEDALPLAENLHIVSRCITALALKACTDPCLFSWPVSSGVAGNDAKILVGSTLWNGIRPAAGNSKSNCVTADWWYDDVSSLRLPLYKRLILAMSDRGMSPERISGSVMHYTMRHLPLMGRQPGGLDSGIATMLPVSALSEPDQTGLLEEIVNLLPDRTGVTPTKFLLRLLRTAMVLQAATLCHDRLERRAGSQLDGALLEDILIPSVYYSAETLYDIDCVERMLEYFMAAVATDLLDGGGFVEEEEEGRLFGVRSTPITVVARLIDGYLAEVAMDVNLKMQKFQAVAALIPDYARPMDDGIYRAVDIYLKAHPWLTDSERDQICRLINCQKLSLEACTHASQNDLLPLRFIVQILFFEQLRLRISVAGWFFVSDDLDGSTDKNHHHQLLRNSVDGRRPHQNHFESSNLAFDDIKERVSELEREYLGLKLDLRKVAKTGGRGGIWDAFFRKLGLRRRPTGRETMMPPLKPPMPVVYDDPREATVN